MDALRAWSAPGRRAELIAAAWDAGETTISALAEAARVSRPTVYADLRALGIDPEQRPQEETPMPTTMTIEGLTGDPENDHATIDAALGGYLAQHPDGHGISAEESRLHQLHQVLNIYNRLVETVARENAARRERDRTLHLVENRWEALETAQRWLAAHHSYVKAVAAARNAINTWETAAAELDTVPALRPGAVADHLLDVYERKVLAAGYPPVDKPELDVATEAARLREHVETTHARRQQLAAETLPLATQ